MKHGVGMLKILASADYHLGMKFAGYPDVQEELAEARFLTLERLITTANERGCALFLIAGDLFDRVTVSARDVQRASALLSNFQGQLVAVLPGNHDFFTGVSSALWSRFSETAGDRILLLSKPKVYDLDHFDLNIRLYAGPCDSKHSQSNAILWLKEQNTSSASVQAEDVLRIGVAHGSIEGISPDAQGLYFPMKRNELDHAPVNLWIIGHTHRQHPSGGGAINTAGMAAPSVLIPGTPEADGFDCRHGGTAWMIEVDEKRKIHIESLSTGIHRFIQEEHNLESADDLKRLEKRLGAEDMQRTLLRLRLSGRLGAQQLVELRQVLREAEESLFFAQIDDSRLLERISEQTVEAEFTEGSFPFRLLKNLIAVEDFEALQTAYALLQEQKR
jgi:DNA repair exonuclease SbcCD nuclease subunit